MKSYSYQPAGTIDVSTTGNIAQLDPKGCGLVRMTNASLATIQGIKAGFPGQRLVVLSLGAGRVNCSHQSGSAAAGDKLFNFVANASFDTPLAAGVGAATYEYDDVSKQWQLICHEQGDYINVAYAAGNFTAGGSQTWTVDSGDQNGFAFYLSGRSLALAVQLVTTSIGGTPNPELRVALPSGLHTATAWTFPGFTIKDSGVSTTHEICLLNSVAGNAYVSIYLLGAPNWPATTNTTSIYMNVAFPVS